MRIVAKRGFPVILLLVGMALGFFLAAQWVPSVSAVPRQDYESLEAFTNILTIVKKNYVEDVDTKNLVSGAINGMLSSLDPHSAYLTPELYKELQMDTQGRFGGLGIEITVKGGILTVVSPIEDTPAAKAGVKPGDQIFKIEDEFTKDMTLVDAVKKMRGPKGTKITISVKREGVPELINFTLMRDTIRVQSVRSRNLDLPALYRRGGAYEYSRGFNWRAMVALGLGVLVALVGLLLPALRWLYDYAWFVGFLISAVAYCVLMGKASSVEASTVQTSVVEP